MSVVPFLNKEGIRMNCLFRVSRANSEYVEEHDVYDVHTTSWGEIKFLIYCVIPVLGYHWIWVSAEKYKPVNL